MVVQQSDMMGMIMEANTADRTGPMVTIMALVLLADLAEAIRDFTVVVVRILMDLDIEDL